MLSLNKNNDKFFFLIVKEKSLPRLLISLSQEYVEERLTMFCRRPSEIVFDKE